MGALSHAAPFFFPAASRRGAFAVRFAASAAGPLSPPPSLPAPAPSPAGRPRAVRRALCKKGLQQTSFPHWSMRGACRLLHRAFFLQGLLHRAFFLQGLLGPFPYRACCVPVSPSCSSCPMGVISMAFRCPLVSSSSSKSVCIITRSCSPYLWVPSRIST